MSRVPRIRFKGFEEDWEQRKLGEIVKEVNRVDENSNAPVMMITANDGFIEQSERYSTDNAGKSLKKYILLKRWELAYNHGASKIRPFGSCFALTRAANIRIPFVYHCFLALEDNPEFLEHTLNGKNVENQLRKIVSSGARMDGLLNISFQEYTSIFIRCPIRKEQDKIAILIKSLDHLITLHQRKLEKLKTIKKSMLEIFFPQNGEKTPKIRFSGFIEDWEQRKHGEVFIYLRNNALSREELNDEDGFAQSIHYGDVLIKYGECLNVSNELLPYIDNKNIVNKFKKFYIQNGDVIIADTAEDETVGKCIEISGIVDHNIISGLHTIPLRPVNKFAYGYLGFYLNSNIYHNQLKPLMQGIKVTSISKNLLKTTTLNYPSNIQEQKIIGRYFDALNHLITLHQSKLEKLQKIKKSMLESMFV